MMEGNMEFSNFFPSNPRIKSLDRRAMIPRFWIDRYRREKDSRKPEESGEETNES